MNKGVWGRILAGLGLNVLFTAVAVAGDADPGPWGQGAVNLPEVMVYSSRVANQSSAAAFAMPISALRYEPRVDIQGRNLAEAQSDITVRGGIFENTGIKVGALTISDPQTGHYLAELPVAPAMMGAPQVATGADLALSATNATVGAIAYDWRPILSAGAATLSLGEYNLRRVELYQGVASVMVGSKRRLGFDVAAAHSRSSGAVPFGDHDFNRATFRIQSVLNSAQTDLVVAYQGKRFGWPNLYTPFNSNEQENIQTRLLLLNHRVEFAPGEHWEVGVFQRRNKDDYAFNRFAPLGPVHPFQHTTWLNGGALAIRRMLGVWCLDLRGEVLADEIESTSLLSGRFRTRLLSKIVLVAQRDWHTAASSRVSVRAGLLHDDSNRDAGSLSPLVEVARHFQSGGLSRVYLAFSRTSQLPSYTALNSSATAGLFRGNANLGRSASRNLELGVKGSAAGWQVDAAAFSREDRQLVDWTFRQGITARTANPVDVDVGGVECVARRHSSNCDLVIGYTWLGKEADYSGAAVDASFYALNYARHRLTAAVTVRLGREFELRLDNAARWQAGNPLRISGGDQALTSAIGLFFRPERWTGVEFSARVDNAWGDRFQEVPAVPASPRQFSAAVASVW